MSNVRTALPGDDDTDEADATARLLRIAGPRPASSDERFVRVKQKVQLHWEAGLTLRLARRRVAIGTGLLAAAAAVVLLVVRFGSDGRSSPTGATVAWVARISGSTGDVSREEATGAMSRLALDDGIRIGEVLDTGKAGRLALRLSDGTSLRLDVTSRVKVIAPRALELVSGAVYVDTGSTAAGYEIRTPLGTARDIGTQFEVRLVATQVRLRVRTGVVELTYRQRTLTGHGGTEILFSATDAESRPIAPYGPEWNWTTEASPAIDIEGVSLATYLGRLARERGLSVQYADSSLAREANGIILHGSVSGLMATEALDVAIGTSGLVYRLDEGRLVVARESSR